jgi:hypothetical protein
MTDISGIVYALEAEGVFSAANLLDPATLTRIALNLADARSPEEYGLWVHFYADGYQVDVNDLAANVLIVLANCNGHVKPDVVEASRRHVRALATA